MGIISYLIAFIYLLGTIQEVIAPAEVKSHSEIVLADLHSYCEDPFLVDKLKQRSIYSLVDFLWIKEDNQYDEDRIEPYIAKPNISGDSIQRGHITQNTYLEEGIDNLDRPIYINFWNRGMLSSTLADVPDRVVFLYMRDCIAVIQFQDFVAYNGPSSRVNATVDILKVELVYIDDEITSCDITPFLDECWELTTDITKVNHTKISEIPFYQYVSSGYDNCKNAQSFSKVGCNSETRLRRGVLYLEPSMWLRLRKVRAGWS